VLGKIIRTRDFNADDVLRVAATHSNADIYTFRYYVDYVLMWDKDIHKIHPTAHEYALDRLMRDGWSKPQIQRCQMAYAQVEKFLAVAKAQGLKHKVR
jgi:hypothetical protein